MNNKYIITAAIKGSEDRLHRLSYDLVDQTEDSIKELIRFVRCLDERSTKVYDKFGSNGFCVQKYKFDENSAPEVVDMRDLELFDTLYNSIEPVEQNEEIDTSAVKNVKLYISRVDPNNKEKFINDPKDRILIGKIDEDVLDDQIRIALEPISILLSTKEQIENGIRVCLCIEDE